MLGMSATPWRRDKLSKLIFWHLGDLHFHLDRKMLMESGDLLSAQVIFRETEFKPYHDPVREYSKMLAELVADDNRNQMITGDISREVRENSDVLLVISDRKAHCKILKALLQFRHHISSDLLTGDLSMDQRREILHRLNKGEVKVMIATGQLVGEGLDCRSLSTLFLVTPIRFSGRLIQYLGRVLRPAPGKSIATVYDYVDVHVPQLKAAARNRQKVYRGGG
jgi:superfamily II DNA or RNA helicase